MDTEKLLETERKIEAGKSLNDEGPYYHHAWWESYKAASKGEMGGTVVGALLGAVVGIAATAVAAVITPHVTIAALAATIIPAFSAGGILYGVHKFSNVGAATGAVASTAQQGEVRMRAFEEGKFSELKQEIGELKAMIKGEAPPPRKGLTAKDIAEELDDYRTTHYAKLETPLKNKFAFWKIALAGLVLGMVAGAILAASGGTAHLLAGIGLAIGGHGGILGEVASVVGVKVVEYGVSMLAVGALGASFGINRDVFRRVFDKTDLWFGGIFTGKQHEIVEAKQIEEGKKALKNGHGKSHDSEIATVTALPAYEGHIDYPSSSTYHRDKVLAAAEKALLSFDHTRATPQ